MNPVGLGPGLRPPLAPAALRIGLIPVVESVLGASTSWACALSTFQPHMALLPNSYPPPPKVCSRYRLSTCRPRQALTAGPSPPPHPGPKALHPDLLSAWGQGNGHSGAANQSISKGQWKRDSSQAEGLGAGSSYIPATSESTKEPGHCNKGGSAYPLTTHLPPCDLLIYFLVSGPRESL